MKKLTLAICTALIIAFLFNITPVALQSQNNPASSQEVPYISYTYWVDYNKSEKTPVYSKPMYEADKVIPALDLSANTDSKIYDISVDDKGNTYILDGGNSCVYILNSNYEFVSSIKNIELNGEHISFTDAKGIYVDKKGLIYIADTENARVLIIDNDGKVKKLLLLPDSNLIPSDFNYRPVKVAVDSEGYTYISCDGSYYGAILYSPEMEFLGFFGANTVKTGIVGSLKKLWDRFTSNDVKRAADEISLPFTINDIVVGTDDFIYTVTGKTGDAEIQTGQVCVFNPGGKEVLDESDKNFADYDVGYHELNKLTQNLCGIDVDENGFFYLLDSTYGRIFWYDSRGELFSIFGGSSGQGDQKGTFANACAIAVNGSDILVADSKKNSLTVFKLTDYGQYVQSGQIKTLGDDNISSKDIWENVIKEDTNCQMAYRGLAATYLDAGEYQKAMEYAKKGADRDTYADAFEKVRTETLVKNFMWIFLFAVLLIVIIVVISIYKKRHSIVIVKNEKLKTLFSLTSHPFEGFRRVKEYNSGSVFISIILLILLYVVTVLNDTCGGFAFTVFDNEEYNALYVLLSTVGLAILLTISNWLVCSLVGGTGELSEIFIVIAYSTVPITFSRIVRLLLTHVIVPNESVFLSVFMTVCGLYALFMFIVGIMKIHDFEFGKFVGTTIFTVVGILIIVFLLFLIFMLAQQVITWLKTLYIEIRYR